MRQQHRMIYRHFYRISNLNDDTVSKLVWKCPLHKIMVQYANTRHRTFDKTKWFSYWLLQ